MEIEEFIDEDELSHIPHTHPDSEESRLCNPIPIDKYDIPIKPIKDIFCLNFRENQCNLTADNCYFSHDWDLLLPTYHSKNDKRERYGVENETRKKETMALAKVLFDGTSIGIRDKYDKKSGNQIDIHDAAGDCLKFKIEGDGIIDLMLNYLKDEKTIKFDDLKAVGYHLYYLISIFSYLYYRIYILPGLMKLKRKNLIWN